MQKFIVQILVIAILNAMLLPAWGWAGNISNRKAQEYAQGGQSAGQAILPQDGSLSTGNDQGDVTLFPGSNDSQTLNANELFGSHQSPSTSSQLTNSYNNEDSLSDLIGSSSSFYKSNSDLSSRAYKTVLNGNKGPNDFSEELFANGDRVLDGVFGDNFLDCRPISTSTEKIVTGRFEDIRSCESARRAPISSCHIERDSGFEQLIIPVKLAVQGNSINTFSIDLIDGTFEAVNPSDGDFFEGEVGSYNYSSFCSDDHQIVDVSVQGYSNWNFFPEPPYNPNYTIDVLEYPSCSNGVKTKIQIIGQAEEGEEFSYGTEINILITYRTHDSWQGFSPDCQELLDGIEDGFWTGSTECQEYYQTGDFGSIQPQEDWFVESIGIPEDGNGICKSAQIILDSDVFWAGQMDCWIDINGEEQCPYNDGTNFQTHEGYSDNCQDYRGDDCEFVDRECMENGRGDSGRCYMYEARYNCGEEYEFTEGRKETVFKCTGGDKIRCLGDECVSDSPELNAQFGQAAAYLEAVQYMAADMVCGEEASSCRIFGGDTYKCKKAVFGWVNCCSMDGGNVNVGDYVKFLVNTNKVFSSQSWFGMNNPVYGGWNAVKETASIPWEETKNAFSSAWENMSSMFSSGSTATATGKAGAAAAGAAEATFAQNVTTTLAKWTGNAFGDQVRDLMFKQVSTGVFEFAPMIVSIFNWVTLAYSCYQILEFLVFLIWKCTSSEGELAVKRDMKVCHHLGSYCSTELDFFFFSICIEKKTSFCCFNSPLSRILQQQIRKQLGISWGSPKSPKCGGLTINQIQATNWDKVDLSEWMGMLNLAGENTAAGTINIDTLTGSGSRMDATGGRDNAKERAENLFDQGSIDDLRDNVAEHERNNL